MTEQELRSLVRQAIAAHVGAQRSAMSPAPLSAVKLHTRHPSHALFTLPAEPGDTCVIEPSVECTHCGFCKTYGH
jgi:hypothetical protein